MIRLELSDEDRAAIAEELDDPTTEPRLHRRLMTVRLHYLSVPPARLTTTSPQGH
jgi:hypothetical protein